MNAAQLARLLNQHRAWVRLEALWHPTLAPRPLLVATEADADTWTEGERRRHERN